MKSKQLMPQWMRVNEFIVKLNQIQEEYGLSVESECGCTFLYDGVDQNKYPCDIKQKVETGEYEIIWK